MFLDTGDKQFTAHFQHFRDSREHWLTRVKIHPGRCEVKGCVGIVTQPEEFYQGVAKCCARDQFTKRTGRKIALERAIRPMPRDIRKEIWQAYWRQCSPQFINDTNMPPGQETSR
jgi:hypothetical protein